MPASPYKIGITFILKRENCENQRTICTKNIKEVKLKKSFQEKSTAITIRRGIIMAVLVLAKDYFVNP